MIAKFFKGLITSGAWCCFDEFNRIFIEVLSVIAQLMLSLFKIKKGGKDSKVEYEGSIIRMHADFSVFVTMNHGYKGKIELPDNLKYLFR